MTTIVLNDIGSCLNVGVDVRGKLLTNIFPRQQIV
jgi:hypothetical protein